MKAKKKKLYGKSRTVPILKSTTDVLSWLKRAKMRKIVFLKIDKMTMPSDIVAQLTDPNKRKSATYYAQVSRAIAELESQSLIRCLNPEEKTGRFYQLTLKGIKIRKLL